MSVWVKRVALPGSAGTRSLRAAGVGGRTPLCCKAPCVTRLCLCNMKVNVISHWRLRCMFDSSLNWPRGTGSVVVVISVFLDESNLVCASSVGVEGG